jgi:putative hydrolase of the HAD superfamily
MRNSTKFLLFDFGGVVVEIYFERVFDIWSYHSGIAMHELKSRFSFDAAYCKHERGEIEASEYFATLRDSLGISISDTQFEEGWMAMFGCEVEGIETLLNQLQDHYSLHLFSNSNSMHYNYWSEKYSGTLQAFQNIFVSSEIGKRKPDVDAFLSVANAIGTSPENILLFDDTLENIEGARNAGLKAELVNSVADINTALEKENLLL